MGTLLNSPVQKLGAISLTVADIERSIDFYRKALSFELVSELTVPGNFYGELVEVPPTEMRLATLQLGNEQIELMEYRDLSGKPIPSDSQSNDLWFQHMAIVVSDLDQAYDHLTSFAIEPISTEPQRLPSGIQAFKFRDPDRHALEIIWFPPELSNDKWPQDSETLFLGIDHSAIAVANTDQSLKFYRDFLGMTVEESRIHAGPEQADMDGLPEAKVRVTSLRPQHGGLGLELLDYLVPGDGRPCPNDWKSYDLAHMQVQLMVSDIEQVVDDLKQNQVDVMTSKIVPFPAFYPYRQGCLVKDSSGHAMVLVTV